MILITIRGVTFSYDDDLLLDHVDLNIKSCERICLIGRNGVGKTTLMGIIAGNIQVDSGDVWISNNIKKTGINYLPQNISLTSIEMEGDAFQFVCRGLGELGKSVSIHRSVEENILDINSFSKEEYIYLQKVFDVEKGWIVCNRVQTILSSMSIPDRVPVKNFSAGIQRKVLLARALVAEPDILFLDEPTNHMDLNFILWLEKFLLKFKKTLIFTTHDRSMIKALATRIIEIDMGKIFSWECGYETYLKKKEKCLLAKKHRENCFDKKMLSEENWIRQGIKARRTRNEGRVKKLEKMREILRNRRKDIGNIKFKVNQGDSGGKLVVEADNIVFSYQGKSIIKNFSCKIMQGDRIGIIGPNGSGKTTLIRLLLKTIEPDSGLVFHGKRINIAYFDQLRKEIDNNKTAIQNVFDGNDVFEIDGKQRHAIGYLRDFLFSYKRSSIPTRLLSGGEKNRLLLAKLFSKPTNFLVLDEPTNDLDLETLELLEELLINYNGTILVVSHDRSFIEQVVTSLFVIDTKGQINTFIGGCDEWYNKQFESVSVYNHGSIVTKMNKRKKHGISEIHTNKKKISYMGKRELKRIILQIESAEILQRELLDLISKPAFYKQETNFIINKKKELLSVQKDLESLYGKWEFLEALL